MHSAQSYPDLKSNNPIVAAYVDRYQLYQQHKKNQYKEDPKQEARLLKMLFNVLAPDKRLLAIVDQYDKEGIEAYGAEGYDLRTMNGDRPQELLHLVNREAAHQQNSRPKYVVVVSDDPTFVQLCSAAEQSQAEVAVWLPGFQRPGQLVQFDTRPLGDLLPEIHFTEASAVIWLDIENLLISLKKLGIRFGMKEFVAAIRNAVSDLGNIKSTVAYGDFGLLASEFGQDLRNQLDELDVVTHHLRSIKGKSSADMKIASDIHTFLEHDPHVQTIIIGTGDRDFRPTVDAAHNRGKKVILLAVEGSLSPSLKQAVDKVFYLDKLLTPKLSPTLPLQPVSPNSEWTDFLCRFVYVLQRNRWHWCPRKQLGNLATTQRLQDAVEAGILNYSRPGDTNGFVINPAHKLAQAIQFFVPWVVGRVDHLIEVKVNTGKMKYVDSKFLHMGMLADNKFKEFGIGQSRENANAWLDAATKAEILVKKPMPHFNEPGKVVDTWWPIGHSGETLISANEPESQSEEPTQNTENNVGNTTQHHSATEDQQAGSRPARNEKKERDTGTYA